MEVSATAYRKRPHAHSLLPPQVVGRVRLDAHEAASHELPVVHDVVGLSGKHGLDVVLSIADNEAVPVTSLCRWGHLLYLEALKSRHREQLLGLVGVVEDGT